MVFTVYAVDVEMAVRLATSDLTDPNIQIEKVRVFSTGSSKPTEEVV
jgi:hypothetical protein